MSNDQSRRIPASESTAYSTWIAPEIKEGQIVQAEKLRDRGPRGELVNIDKNEIIYNQLTAAQFEAITLQAYEDVRQAAQKEGYRQGFEEGQQAGLASGQKTIDAEVENLHQVIGHLMHVIAGQENDVEEALVNISVNIASSVLRRELSLDSSHIGEIVNEAVSKLPMGSEAITIMLNEADLNSLKERSDIPSQWQLQRDLNLDRGGCRIVTRQSVVDYSMQEQFQQVVDSLVEERFNQLAIDREAQSADDSSFSDPSSTDPSEDT